jgi:hypothetical protein
LRRRVGHTKQFAIDDWWISDYNSYIFQQPASMFVMAQEDKVVLQISYEAEQQLKKREHVYETFFCILAIIQRLRLYLLFSG